MGNRRHSFDPGEIDGLLATGGGALKGLADGMESTETPAEAERWVGARFGPFEVVEFLDRGGMSLVFRAERRDGDFEQSVAVKLLDARGSEQMGARFARERQILAGLEHPNIARVIDGGISGGQPYMVMELVAGMAVDRYCDEHRLDLNDRIDLFIGICEAVQFAHTHLVVHRDIKPGNILITDQGEVKLLDFGIAKLLIDDGNDLTTGTPLLTPRFASPEQVLGQPVNVASDIYQLGLLLHLLLTGTHAQPVGGASIADIKKAVIDTEPLSPSKALETTGNTDGGEGSRIAQARRTRFDRLQRRMRGDLDIIVGACVAKSPARRYGSVQRLIDDLRAYREHRPIQARSPSRAYRLARFARRHRGGVAATLLTLVALLISLAAVLLSWRETLQAQQIAEREARTSEAVSGFLADLLEQADPRDSGGEQLAVVELLDQGAANLERLAEQPEVQIQLLKTMAGAYFGLGRYDSVEQLARRALALQDSSAEFDLRIRIQILRSLGSALVGLGRPDEAMRTAEEAVRLAEALGPEFAYNQAEALHAMAIALFDNGQPKQAIELDEKALILLGEGPETLQPRAIILTTIGSATRKLGDYETALEYFQRAFDLASNSEELKFQRGFILRGMAQTLYARGEPLKAREMATRAVATDQSVYGEQSDKNFRSLIVLALYDLKLLDLPAADAHFAEVFRIADALGEKHPNYAVARYYGSLHQHRKGLLEEARGSIEAASVSRRAVYGDDDRALLEYEMAKAVFDLDEGRAPEAQARLAALNDALPEAYGPGHQVRREFDFARARAAAGMGDHRSAIALLDEMTARYGSPGSQPAEYGRYLEALGRSQAAVGDRGAAERHLLHALDFQQRLYGIDSPTTLGARIALAALRVVDDPDRAGSQALAASEIASEQAELGDPWAMVLLAQNVATLRKVGETARARADCAAIDRVLTARMTGDPPAKREALALCAAPGLSDRAAD